MVDYLRDNHFAELKNMEIMRERIQSLNDINDYVGEDGYFSKEWVMKNVLQFTDDDIKQMGVSPEGEPEGPDDNEADSQEPPPEA